MQRKRLRACWRLHLLFHGFAADFVLLQPALGRAKLGLQLALGHVCRRTVTPSQHPSGTNRRAPALKVKLTISRAPRTKMISPLQCSKLYAGICNPICSRRRLGTIRKTKERLGTNVTYFCLGLLLDPGYPVSSSLSSVVFIP